MKKIFLLVTFFLFSLSLFANEHFIPITGGDGKISYEDIETHLIWTRDYVPGKTWQQALEYCEELKYGGFADWRLPNIDELLTLINIAKRDPASDLPNVSSEYFWSSSSHEVDTYSAWVVHFNNGQILNLIKYYGRAVRCIRPK